MKLICEMYTSFLVVTSRPGKELEGTARTFFFLEPGSLVMMMVLSNAGMMLVVCYGQRP